MRVLEAEPGRSADIYSVGKSLCLMFIISGENPISIYDACFFFATTKTVGDVLLTSYYNKVHNESFVVVEKGASARYSAPTLLVV